MRSDFQPTALIAAAQSRYSAAMLDQGFQITERLGAFERTAADDIVSYPLGYMFPGVRTRSHRFFSRRRRWKTTCAAAAVMVLIAIVFKPGRDWLHLTLFYHAVLLWMLLDRAAPLLFAPATSRVVPTPWRRLVSGEIMLPLYDPLMVRVFFLMGAAASLIAWLALVLSSSVHRVAKTTLWAELAALAFATAAYRAYCNWRINRASAARLAKNAEAYVWPRRLER